MDRVETSDALLTETSRHSDDLRVFMDNRERASQYSSEVVIDSTSSPLGVSSGAPDLLPSSEVVGRAKSSLPLR